MIKAFAISGLLSSLNTHAFHYGSNNLIAYGAHSLLAVFDPVTGSYLKVFDYHTTTITLVRWAPHALTERLEGENCPFVSTAKSNFPLLASLDIQGNLFVFDICTGNVTYNYSMSTKERQQVALDISNKIGQKSSEYFEQKNYSFISAFDWVTFGGSTFSNSYILTICEFPAKIMLHDVVNHQILWNCSLENVPQCLVTAPLQLQPSYPFFIISRNGVVSSLRFNDFEPLVEKSFTLSSKVIHPKDQSELGKAKEALLGPQVDIVDACYLDACPSFILFLESRCLFLADPLTKTKFWETSCRLAPFQRLMIPMGGGLLFDSLLPISHVDGMVSFWQFSSLSEAPVLLTSFDSKRANETGQFGGWKHNQMVCFGISPWCGLNLSPRLANCFAPRMVSISLKGHVSAWKIDSDILQSDLRNCRGLTHSRWLYSTVQLATVIAVQPLQFGSDDGTLAVIGNQSGLVFMMNLQTRHLFRAFKVHNGSPVRALEWISQDIILSFSFVENNDGKVFNELILLNVLTGQQVNLRKRVRNSRFSTLSGNPNLGDDYKCSMIAVSPDRRLLAVVDFARIIEIWDIDAVANNPAFDGVITVVKVIVHQQDVTSACWVTGGNVGGMENILCFSTVESTICRYRFLLQDEWNVERLAIQPITHGVFLINSIAQITDCLLTLDIGLRVIITDLHTNSTHKLQIKINEGSTRPVGRIIPSLLDPTVFAILTSDGTVRVIRILPKVELILNTPPHWRAVSIDWVTGRELAIVSKEGSIRVVSFDDAIFTELKSSKPLVVPLMKRKSIYSLHMLIKCGFGILKEPLSTQPNKLKFRERSVSNYSSNLFPWKFMTLADVIGENIVSNDCYEDFRHISADLLRNTHDMNRFERELYFLMLVGDLPRVLLLLCFEQSILLYLDQQTLTKQRIDIKNELFKGSESLESLESFEGFNENLLNRFLTPLNRPHISEIYEKIPLFVKYLIDPISLLHIEDDVAKYHLNSVFESADNKVSTEIVDLTLTKLILSGNIKKSLDLLCLTPITANNFLSNCFLAILICSTRISDEEIKKEKILNVCKRMFYAANEMNKNLESPSNKYLFEIIQILILTDNMDFAIHFLINDKNWKLASQIALFADKYYENQIVESLKKLIISNDTSSTTDSTNSINDIKNEHEIISTTTTSSLFSPSDQVLYETVERNNFEILTDCFDIEENEFLLKVKVNQAKHLLDAGNIFGSIVTLLAARKFEAIVVLLKQYGQSLLAETFLRRLVLLDMVDDDTIFCLPWKLDDSLTFEQIKEELLTTTAAIIHHSGISVLSKIYLEEVGFTEDDIPPSIMDQFSKVTLAEELKRAMSPSPLNHE
eukprot:TRINITY_DN551_c0_g1_i1.p1 TRINITY_DN551_c0_g1~~TRINITY_DN551_c0_g1_i1.p1  ORF type:complete len:1342 (+),score=324.73 TRINITY_DN551_c0_g1_i1:36-4061(+)